VVVVLLCIAGMFLLVTRSKSRDERAPRALPALEKTQEASA
jgi:hypothetical protein